MTLSGPGVDAFPTLFSPGKLGTVELANRAIVSPVLLRRRTRRSEQLPQFSGESIWDLAGEDRIIDKGIRSYCVAVSADGKKLAATYQVPRIRLFDLPINDLRFKEINVVRP